MKNKHLDHVEDLVLKFGQLGADTALSILESIGEDLSGSRSNRSVKITTKWDGAPSIFAGIDPADGKFFVASKSILKKTPEVFKSLDSIDADPNPARRKKFKVAFEELSQCNIKGVIQGDFLFSQEDVSAKTIAGTQYITFHPNTIVYAVPAKSDLAKEILSARIGMVWHTRYRGNSLSSLSGVSDAKISDSLKVRKAVWTVGPSYLDVTGQAEFSYTEASTFRTLLKVAKGISVPRLEGLLNPTLDVSYQVLAAVNDVNKSGRKDIANQLYVAIIKRVSDYYSKRAQEVSTNSAKQGWMKAKDEFVQNMERNKGDMLTLLSMYANIVQLKEMIVHALDKISKVNTFLRSTDGSFRVTTQEGFVAMDLTGNMVKLVDRLEFSLANFSDLVAKGWPNRYDF